MASVLDVLVVGAGPIGLISALALAQNGLTVQIIEKQNNITIGQRGPGIAPRSLEAYHFLGLLSDIKKVAELPLNVKEYDTEGNQRVYSMIPISEPTPDIPEPNYLLLGQGDSGNILRNHLKTYGVNVQFSTELVSIHEDEAGITAIAKGIGAEEQQIRAKFIVGADGGKGTMRKLKGIPFVGKSIDSFKALIGDVELLGITDPQFWFVFKSTNTSIILDGLPDHDMARARVDLDFLQHHVREISRMPSITIRKMIDFQEWRPNIRMVDAFRAGRVLLAGDAAHVHPPTGGQGLNSGVIDVMNLAWKLALVCKGLAPSTLLDTYSEERVPVIREMLQLTAAFLDKTIARADDALQRPLPLRQLGVHCRWSSIVYDEVNGADNIREAKLVNAYAVSVSDRLFAGDRAPDAPELLDHAGTPHRLFDIFKITYHTILVFDSGLVTRSLAINSPQGTARIIAIVDDVQSVTTSTYLTVLRDSQGHAGRAYGADRGVKIAIVRPDGVVGALLQSVEGISEYFRRILNA